MDATVRLRDGYGVLDRWSTTATDAERDAAYTALFGLVEDPGAVRYRARGERGQFRLRGRCGVVLHGRMHERDFEIVHIGRCPPTTADVPPPNP